MTGVAVEQMLELWCVELRQVKAHLKSLFAHPSVAASAAAFLDGLLGPERRKTGWMRAEAAGDAGPWRQQASLRRPGHCLIGANLSMDEAPCLGELALSPSWSLAKAFGQQGTCVAPDRDGQHAADGGEQRVTQHLCDTPEREGTGLPQRLRWRRGGSPGGPGRHRRSAGPG